MDKKKSVLTNFIIALVLFLLPLRHVNQGLDISDTGYSLTNFKWFGALEFPWHYSIAGANMVGKLLMGLPFGNTWIGINLYCSILISLFSLVVYFFLIKKIPVWCAALGLIIAQMLCWCPQVILYNYLTYIFLGLGTVIIITALDKGNDGNKKAEGILFVSAGFMLGAETLVRMANLSHMALILLVWFNGLLKKQSVREIIRKTGICLAGYVIGLGFAVVLMHIGTPSGLSGFINMLGWLGNVTQTADSYSPVAMLLSPFADYLDALRWMLPFVLVSLLAVLFRKILERVLKHELTGNISRIYVVLYVLFQLLILRILYGRGMFGLDYNEYFSFIRPAGWLVGAGLVAGLAVLVIKDDRISDSDRLLALAAVIAILIVPLGSNNRSYPAYNNLFIAGPVIIYLIHRLPPRRAEYRAVTIILLTLITIQSVGFGSTFVFRDSSASEKRDTKIENSDILTAMKTGRTRAREINELVDLTRKNGYSSRSGIFYGDIAGLSYALDIPSEMHGVWVSLESYNWKQWNDEMGRIVYESMNGNYPVIFIAKDYMKYPNDELKRESLKDFMEDSGYVTVLENDLLTVYDVK